MFYDKPDESYKECIARDEFLRELLKEEKEFKVNIYYGENLNEVFTFKPELISDIQCFYGYFHNLSRIQTAKQSYNLFLKRWKDNGFLQRDYFTVPWSKFRWADIVKND